MHDGHPQPTQIRSVDHRGIHSIGIIKKDAFLPMAKAKGFAHAFRWSDCNVCCGLACLFAGPDWPEANDEACEVFEKSLLEQSEKDCEANNEG